MLFLPRSLAGLCNCAAKETARYSMTGVMLKKEPHGGFRAEATDGRRLLIAQEGPYFTIDKDVADAKEILGNYAGSLPDEEVAQGIVPVDVLRQAFAALGKLKSHKPEEARRLWVFLGPQEAILWPTIYASSSGPVFRTPYVEGRFPDVSCVIPKTQPQAVFKVNAELMIGLLQGVRPLLDESGCVTVCCYPKAFPDAAASPVALTATNGAGLFSDALIMPLS